MLASLGEDPETAKLLSESFVCANYYCTDASAEAAPRASRKHPEFTFQDRSVPLIVILDPQGKELAHQLGVPPTEELIAQVLKGMIRDALKKHGPVAPPKEAAALRKDLEAAAKARSKGVLRDAVKALLRAEKSPLVKAAKDQPDEEASPSVREVRALRASLEEEAGAALEKARAEADPALSKKALQKVAADYEGLGAAQEAKEALKPPAP